jgi:DNA-binding XRE family transcriptional regulator
MSRSAVRVRSSALFFLEVCRRFLIEGQALVSPDMLIDANVMPTGGRSWVRSGKLNQIELAEEAGVSLMTISRIERGEHDPHIKTLARIAAALGVSILDVLRSAGYSEDDDPEG